MANETVKIVRFHETGAANVLKVEELPLPEPGAGEVRLRVNTIGLNRAEVMFRMGQYLVQPKLPSKLGYEAAGDRRSHWFRSRSRIGSARPSALCLRFPRMRTASMARLRSCSRSGALAEYPANLSYEEGTSIWMQYLTAYGALIQQGQGDRAATSC